MQIAMVGLGRMGMNMARRLLRDGHQVVAYNRTPARTREFMQEGAQGCFSLAELVETLALPRAVWLMLPAGQAVDVHITELAILLAPGDIIIEGGNSHYKDALRRAELLGKRQIHYIDAGVSGGIWGLSVGYCLMIGGESKIVRHLEPVFTSLAPPEGYLHCGPAGAGHFVKMVHNGIEYGMMQAYGEGFALLEASPYGKELNYAELAHLWNQGSVIRSWLLELLEGAFANDPKLDELLGYVEDSGEGRWGVQAAVDFGVAAPVLALALFQRFQSRQPNSFANRVLAALRREFGGHATRTTAGPKP